MNLTQEIDNSVIWIEVNLKTVFYQPEVLEKGQWFINSLYPGTDREYFELWELEEDVPDSEYQLFIAENGYPVEVVLSLEMQNPDEPDDVVVYSEEIGWMYNIETERVELITLKDVNKIIDVYGGKVFLLVDEWFYDVEGEVVPETKNNLVILTLPFENEEEEN
jgi:hypothetical protein